MRLLILFAFAAAGLFGQADYYRLKIGPNSTGTSPGAIQFETLSGADGLNLDSSVAGFLNIGSGPVGSTNATLRTGTLLLGGYISSPGLTDIRQYGATCDGTNQHASYVAALNAGRKYFTHPPGCNWTLPHTSWTYNPGTGTITVPADSVPAGLYIESQDWVTAVIQTTDPTTQTLYVGPLTSIRNANLKGAGCAVGGNLANVGLTCPSGFYYNGDAASFRPFVSNGYQPFTFDVGGPLDYPGIQGRGHGAGDVFYGEVDGTGGSAFRCGSQGAGENCFVAERKNNATAFYIYDNNPGATAGQGYYYYAKSRLNGELFRVDQDTTHFAGDAMFFNMAQGGGTGSFTGTLIRYMNAGVTKFLIDSGGNITSGNLNANLASVENPLPSSLNGALFGFNVSGQTGTYLALETGNRSAYWELSNNGTKLVMTSGTQTAAHTLTGAQTALRFDNSVNATFAGNVTVSPLGTGNVCATSGALYTSGCSGGTSGANALTVDNLHPLYLYAHFADTDDKTLRLSYSRDGINWTAVARNGVLSHSAKYRDPSIVYWNNQFCVIATPATAAIIQYECTPDLLNWTSGSYNLATLLGSSTTAAWAPEWDTTGGTLGFWVSQSTQSNPFNNVSGSFNPCYVSWDPTISMSSPYQGFATCFAISGTTQGRTFDFFPWYDGSFYYLFYVDQQPGSAVVQPIAYAKSSSHFSGYTQQTTPGTSWLSVTSQSEAPALFKVPNGNLAALVDTWTYPPQGGRHYTPWLQIFGGSGISTSMSTASLQPINIPRAEHGTVIAITSQSVANLVYTAASKFSVENTLGWGSFSNNRSATNFRAPYSFTITAPLAPAGDILYPEPATLGFDTGSPTSEIATLTGCGTFAQSCWPDVPGNARLFQNYLGNGNFGQFQFINATNTGMGEASLLLCDGCAPQTQADTAPYTNTGCTPGTFISPGLARPGPGPCPVSVRGDKSIWTFGINNQSIDLGSGNDRFFLYNKGIVNYNSSGTLLNYGGFPLQIDPSTGEMRVNYGITLGGAVSNTAYGHDRFASIWSSGQNVIEMGNGTSSTCVSVFFTASQCATAPFQNHSAIVKMGSAVIEYSGADVIAHISGDNGRNKDLRYETLGGARWIVGAHNTEFGSNTGSDLYWDAFADNGVTSLGTAMWISRSGLVVSMRNLSLTNLLTVTSGTKALCVIGSTVVISSSNICPP